MKIDAQGAVPTKVSTRTHSFFKCFCCRITDVPSVIPKRSPESLTRESSLFQAPRQGQGSADASPALEAPAPGLAESAPPMSQKEQLRTAIDNILAQSRKPGSLSLKKCLNQQALIQHGMDMLNHGSDQAHTAQVCANMTILCQGELKNLLKEYTPERQNFITQYGMDVVKNGHDLEFVNQVCEYMAFLCQSNINEITTEDVIGGATVSPLGQCTPEQQAYILQYGIDMIRDGNKPEWATQVCASMAILYQSGIEAYIPAEITIENNQTSDAIRISMTDLNSVFFLH
jgi:hypothetical protein